MKQFSLSEYLKNPTRPIITRDGRSARIICTDRVGRCPIVALISDNGEELIWSFTTDGKKYAQEMEESDLFFAPIKKEGWINIYKYNLSSLITPGSQVYNTKEEAESAIGSGLVDCISTIKIQWEE